MDIQPRCPLQGVCMLQNGIVVTRSFAEQVTPLTNVLDVPVSHLSLDPDYPEVSRGLTQMYVGQMPSMSFPVAIHVLLCSLRYGSLV